MKKLFLKLFAALFLFTALGVSFTPVETEAATLKKYTWTSRNSTTNEYYCPELVPTRFTWNDNGIPRDILIVSGRNFHFNPAKVFDTGRGGYNYGWYWRKFGARLNNGKTVYFWASAWNLNHLLYG